MTFAFLLVATGGNLLLAAAAPTVALVAPNPDLQYHVQTDQGSDRFFRSAVISHYYTIF